MKLHADTKLFSDILRAASQQLQIKLEFVEKDYWITVLLSRLSRSRYISDAVFKGGTSLSKSYNLIDRFSTDVDIAIINDNDNTGNKLKTIIRTLEKELTTEVSEIQMDGVTSKGSKFRKAVFEYPSIEIGNVNNNLILEINTFANTYPFKLLSIKSFVHDFLIQSGNEDYINQYGLQAFDVNVLSKEQTLMEKMVSLIRTSFDENPIESMSGKIRHFYDLYYLMKDNECAEFVASNSFQVNFKNILQHDREMFDEPLGWQNKSISASPLISDFTSV